jgi:hypothetical protein
MNHHASSDNMHLATTPELPALEHTRKPLAQQGPSSRWDALLEGLQNHYN